MKTSYKGDVREPHSVEDGKLLAKLLEDKAYNVAEMAELLGINGGSAITNIIEGKYQSRSAAHWKKMMNFLQSKPSVPPADELRELVRNYPKEHPEVSRPELCRLLGFHESGFAQFVRGKHMIASTRRRIAAFFEKEMKPEAKLEDKPKKVSHTKTNGHAKSHTNGKSVIQAFKPAPVSSDERLIDLTIRCQSLKAELQQCTTPQRDALMKFLMN